MTLNWNHYQINRWPLVWPPHRSESLKEVAKFRAEISGGDSFSGGDSPKFRLEISQPTSQTPSFGVVKLEVICLFDSGFSLKSLFQVVFS